MTIRQPLPRSWAFRAADVPDRPAAWLPARVPGCVHTDLRRAGKIPDPFWGSNERQLDWIAEKGWVYRCEFIPRASLLRAGHLELVAEGLDTFATVTLNGRKIGRASNMFLLHRFDVTGRLARDRNNVLEIAFRSPLAVIGERMTPDHYPEWNDPAGGASLLRKEQCSFGWDWGPRFPTSGIWQPIYLEAWSANRIESVSIGQIHGRNGVELTFRPTLAEKNKTGVFRGKVSLHGEEIASIANLKAGIRKPELWWPNGHGAQPLYDVCLELLDDAGNVLDVWQRKIGLRTVVLDRHPDAFGESFQFVVNGRPIFAKGANWIPAHSFVAQVDRADYADLLSSAAEANMNMVRVWGGGIYEKEDFYDLCDEKGLLVWQDFMFACALYPGDPAFLESVRAEAGYQVRRLAHRACLALWCGNNEIEQMPQEITKTAARRQAYEDISYQILPGQVAEWDGVTPYWPSSPHNPEGYEAGHNNERAGDCHFWDVWFERVPVKRYEDLRFRFCSEFGMQSYSSPEVAATYCKPADWNVFGPEMENHQKSSAGNQIILDYVSRRFRYARDYPALAVLSQLNQAYCMQVGVEHFRRSMPRTMGALYWQLNDCWPVASWSSLEFGGHWKALHHAARRFFAPALLSAHVPGDETVTGSNRLKSTIREVHLYTVYDAPEAARGILNWTLWDLEKGPLRGGRKPVILRYGEASKQCVLDFQPELEKHGAARLYLQSELSIKGTTVSRQTTYLTAPRNLELQKAPIRAKIRRIAPRQFELTLESKVFQPFTFFDLPGIPYRAEDNYLDLYPGQPRRLVLRTAKEVSGQMLRRKLQVGSLATTY
jgi:beta-mannosidase